MVKYLTLVAALLLIGQTAVFGATLYDFESDAQGWVHQTYTDSQGITGVVQSTPPNPAKAGTYSLKGTAHLIANDTHYSKGETYVTLGSTMNLLGLPTSVWVYAPTGLGGTNDASNGWQMLFKDVNYKIWYGPWENIIEGGVGENTWKQLTVTLGTTDPDYMSSGFDFTQIKRMGVKIGMAGGSTLTYDGPLYVDEYSVVPEPTSMLLLGSGLVGLFGFAVKRKKA